MSANPAPPRAGSITVKLVVVLLAVALLPMLLTAYYNVRGGIEGMTRTEQDNLRLLATSLAQRLDQMIMDTRRVVDVLAGEQEVQAFLGTTGEAREAHRASVELTMANVARVVPEFASVYVMDRDGVFAASTNPQVVGRNYAFREYFQHAFAGERYASDLLFGSTSGEPGVYFSAPVRQAGAIVGVVVIKLRGEVLGAILDSLHTEETATPFLVDSEGVLIHHPDPRLRFTSLTALNAAQANEVLKVKRYPVKEVRSLGLADIARRMAAGAPGYARFTSPLDGTLQVMGFAPLGQQHWMVAVSEPEARFAAPLNALFHNALLSLAALAAAVFLLAL